MTNLEIIQKEKELRGMADDTPLYTYKGWKDLGFQVKKGAKSTIKIMIWKKKKAKKEDKKENEEKKSDSGFFMTRASFFTLDQVEKIKKTEGVA